MQTAGIKIVAQWDASAVQAGIRALIAQLNNLPNPNIGGGGSGGGSGPGGGSGGSGGGGGRGGGTPPALTAIQQLRAQARQLRDDLQNYLATGGSITDSTGRRMAAAFDAVNNRLQAIVRSSRGTRDAYDRLAQAANRATRHAQDLGARYGTNSQQFQVAAERARRLTQRLTEIDAATGRHQRNVGNYNGSLGGMQNALNQITREMPAFTNSIQTGFMAISNNIPMLFDQIKALIEQNRQLAASGQPTISVFRTIALSIFSWQTALSLGVTALTMYGPKIWEMIRGTDHLAAAKKRATERQKEYDQTLDSSNSTAAKQITTVNSLLYTLQKETSTREQQQGALKKLQDIYPSYFKNLDLDDVKNGKIANTIKNELIPALLAAAEARALSDTIAQNTLKDLKLQRDRGKAAKEVLAAEKALNKAREEAAKNTDVVGTDFATAAPVMDNVKVIEAQKSLLKTADAFDTIRTEQKELAADNKIFIDQLDKTSQKLGKLSIDGTDAAKFLGKGLKDGESQAKKMADAITDFEGGLDAIGIKLANSLIKPSDAANERLNQLQSIIGKLLVDFKQTPAENSYLRGLIADAAQLVDTIEITKRKIGEVVFSPRGLEMPTINPKMGADVAEKALSWAQQVQKAAQMGIQYVFQDGIKVPLSVEVDPNALDKTVSNFQTIAGELQNLLQRVAYAALDAIGDIFSGRNIQDVFGNFLITLGGALREFGKQIIYLGVIKEVIDRAIKALSKIGGSAAIVIAGVATIAAGAYLESLGRKQMGQTFAFANGGVVYGPTNALIGEYAGASSNPEVVAPLNRLKDLIGDTGTSRVEVFGKLSGQDILLSGQRAANYNKR
ncbi:hypothetical protein ACTJIJ_11730 [Niabella sp. 22666]|uniref:hypothetical protein n=1 Tax=Niabella sp. 22666 TaxID=3453954 RepID=UPI003F842F69